MSGRIQAVTMPKWGIEMTAGTVSRWNVNEGEAVAKGAPLLEVETEKIVNAVDSPAGGTLRRIVAGPGDVKPVGALLAVLAPAEVSDAELERFIAGFQGATVSFDPQSTPAPPAAAPVGSPASAVDEEEPRVSPIARRLADTLGIDVSRIRGTGRDGRVTRDDVVAAQAARESAAKADSTDNAPTRIRLSATRITIARRLRESKQSIPHYRLSLEATCDALLRRAAEAGRAHGRRITVNDLLLRSCALALIAHPAINAWLEDEELLEFPHADIAVAVAAPSGLITPVVRSADTKSLAEIAAATADLTARARRGALTREDIAGGTFTVSNLGMYGLSRFDAIVNPPQVAILAAGAAEDRVIARDGVPAVAKVMTLTLSADHRAVDGAAAAAFLATLRELIEAPARL